MENIIKQQTIINAPVHHVWEVLINYKKFSEWFCVDLDKPFKCNEVSKGFVSYPGYEHCKIVLLINVIKQESLFSFFWHPNAVDEGTDYSNEEKTLVEFQLEPHEQKTLLTLTETGFDKIPVDRQKKALEMNNQGWTIQLNNIKRYAEKDLI